jgi:solute carrier family 45 protein 1/2/4
MIDLANYFSRLGDSQMKILCFLASFTLLLSISITCWTTSEKPFREQRKSSSSLLIEAKETIQHLMKTVRHLPIPIRRVCHTQFFAWIGWFPFLFYSTTWVAELAGHGDLATQQPGEDRVGDATRTGSFAFLLYSLVSLTTACILPILTQLHTGSNRFTHWLNLPNLYTFAHLLFGTTMLLTWWISRVDVATFAIAICGIAWAIMMWAPFALIGEMINSYPATTETYYDEEQINMTRLSSESTSEDLVVHDSTAPTHHIRDSAGEILGIHNVYIVLPQFISTIMSSVIFACVGQQETSPVAIGWVLRVGGLCVLIAAYMSTRIRRTYHII